MEYAKGRVSRQEQYAEGAWFMGGVWGANRVFVAGPIQLTVAAPGRYGPPDAIDAYVPFQHVIPIARPTATVYAEMPEARELAQADFMSRYWR